MIVVSKLGTLVATIILAPSLSYVVFETLRADSFAPAETFTGLVDWLEAFLLHGDLGYDSSFNEPVTAVLWSGLPVDMTMLAGGLGFGLAAGIGGGLLAVARPRSWSTRVTELLAGLGVSMPVYWMGFAVLMLFAHNSGMIVQLPFVSGAADYEELPSDPIAFVGSLWVPCVVVGTPLAAGVYRMTVAASREVLGEDFVRTASAKGLRPRRVLMRHVFPAASIPVLMLAASQVNLLITNIGLMQSAFNIPGSYREMVRALVNGDTVMLQALIVEGCIIIALANTVADLLQARIDPRVRDAQPQLRLRTRPR